MPQQPHDSIPDHFFAEAIRDELWRIKNGKAILASRRLEQGYARTWPELRECRIEASSDFEAVERPITVPADLPRTLANRVSAEHRDLVERVRKGPCDEIQVRVRHSARLVASRGVATEMGSLVLILETPAASIVTAPPTLDEDVSGLSRIDPPCDGSELEYQAFPMRWRAGSAGVLLHEAIGHRSLHSESSGPWPAWIEVFDDPSLPGPGRLPIDDTGTSTECRNLCRGQVPSARRREDYRQLPIPRMTNLVVAQSNAPFELPKRRIDILHAHEGGYDPLTDEIRIIVTGTAVENDERSRPVRFEIRESHRAIASALEGARGAPVRFPGILCAEEGQRVPTGCWAPEILTKAFERCANGT